MRRWRAHEQRICALSWAPDGRRVASGGNDAVVGVWDADTGERLASLLGHTGAVRSLDWSADGLLASAAEDGTVLVWDPSDGSLCSRFTVQTSWVNAVRWSPDSSRIASAGGDRTLMVTAVEDGSEVVRLPSPFGTFLSVEWSPDGESLAACSRSPLITVWRTSDWTPTSRLSSGGGTVWSVEWLRDGRWLAAGDADGRVLVWDLDTGRPARVIEGHLATVSRVASVASGRLLASLSHDQTIAVWDLDGPQPVALRRDAYPGWTGCVAAHPREEILAAPDSSGRDILVWPIEREGAADQRLAEEATDGRHRDEALRVADETILGARRSGAVTLGLPAVVDAAARRGEPPVRAARIGRTAARHLDVAGEILRLGSSGRLFLRPDALPDLVRAVTAHAARQPAGDGTALLGDVPAELLSAPVSGDAASSVRAALAQFLVRERAGWWSPGPDGGTLLLPDAATRPLADAWDVLARSGRRWQLERAAAATEVVVSLLATTLFPRVACCRDAALLADDAGGVVLVRWQLEDDGRAELRLAVAAPPGTALDRRRSLLVTLVGRLLSARPEPSSGSRELHQPASAVEWSAVDPTAERTWALTFDELATDDEAAVGVLLERIEDERGRLGRLAADGLRAGSEFDILLGHGPDDLEQARLLRDELAVLGVRAWVDEDGELARPAVPHGALDVALRAGVVAALLGASSSQPWKHGPLWRFHEELLARADSPTAARLWWVPVLLPAAPQAPQLPDHLHSFDWYHWRPEPRAARHADLGALLGGVFVDRARQ